MSRYLQTSTANPYGHRPWATALYTGFENYAFLKQPQNAIIREDVNMRPEIYRPPELKKPAAGLGNVTVVTGSGRIVRRARRGTLGAMDPVFDSIFRRGLPPRMVAPANPTPPVSQIIVRGPISTAPPVYQPICEHAAPMPGCSMVAAPTAADPCAVNLTCLPPISILPPSLVPVPPRVVSTGPGGTIYALPGDATTPGSPFAPPDASQISLPSSAVPISTSSAAAAASAAAATSPSSSFSDWFNAASWISGIPNGYLAIGGALAIYMFAKKKR